MATITASDVVNSIKAIAGTIDFASLGPYRMLDKSYLQHYLFGNTQLGLQVAQPDRCYSSRYSCTLSGLLMRNRHISSTADTSGGSRTKRSQAIGLRIKERRESSISP